MAEKPILFSGPMVRAILEGRKTLTRRVLKPQPVNRSGAGPDYVFHKGHLGPADYLMRHLAARFHTKIKIGDTLWVRETWAASGTGVWTIADARSRIAADQKILYRADNDDDTGGWWPSIHMPREFSRITLKVTGVKVERLQDCSAEDAIAEGIAWHSVGYGIGGWLNYLESKAGIYRCHADPRESYSTLWESINGEGSWAANPWVAAYTFERVKP